MSTLTVGTYNEHPYSIRIERLVTSKGVFIATGVVADPEGNITSEFEEHGTEDWALLNHCLKRIITQETE